MCVIFILLLSIWTFQVISCTNIMHLSTERLSGVDPGGPSYVYIPVKIPCKKDATKTTLLLIFALMLIGIPVDMLEKNMGGYVSYLDHMDHQHYHNIILVTWFEAAMTEMVSGTAAITSLCCVLTLPPEMGKCSSSTSNLTDQITKQQQEPSNCNT